MSMEYYQFGPHKIHSNYIFYTTHLSFAMVNLRPAAPGHVLINPKREVKRFVDLTYDEACDLWLTAQKVGAQLECLHKATSLTFTIQDGPQSGQTVPHVHIHIVPRKEADFEKNNVYDAMDKEEELKKKVDLDVEMKNRSHEEMSEEAEAYRLLFL